MTSLHVDRTPAEALIRQEILRRGPMPFDRFVELALYHPVHGYYNQTSPQRGRAGDYFTSAQVSSLFPRIFAETLLAMRAAIGTEQFSLVEVGAGDGEFLAGVLRSLEEAKALRGIRVWAVERGRPAREKLWRKLSRFPKTAVVPSMEEIENVGGLEGCIVSNELFDALPFHRLRRRGGEWAEICVDWDGGWREVERPAGPEITGFLRSSSLPFEEGQEIEARPAAERTIQAWGERLARGFVVTFDYGYPRASLVSPKRPNGTWLCYHRHRVERDPFARIGRQDITAHVDFTALAAAGESAGLSPRLFCSQGMYLTHAGAGIIEEFLSKGSPQDRFKRTSAVQQLVHPDAMGEAFSVLIQAKEAVLPSGLESIPNRARRLAENWGIPSVGPE